MLLFSPHPDDEAITGGLALRLRREAGWRVVNVAVTLGSAPARRAARAEEGKACCEFVGFEQLLADPAGLERINLESRAGDAAHWARCVQRIAHILAAHAPRAICFPHADDWNATHVGTHHLVRIFFVMGTTPFVVRLRAHGADKGPPVKPSADAVDD